MLPGLSVLLALAVVALALGVGAAALHAARGRRDTGSPAGRRYRGRELQRQRLRAAGDPAAARAARRWLTGAALGAGRRADAGNVPQPARRPWPDRCLQRRRAGSRRGDRCSVLTLLEGVSRCRSARCTAGPAAFGGSLGGDRVIWCTAMGASPLAHAGHHGRHAAARRSSRSTRSRRRVHRPAAPSVATDEQLRSITFSGAWAAWAAQPGAAPWRCSR